MTPSQLSIIVKSQGISEATSELKKLAAAADSVDAETKAFILSQAKLAEANKGVSKSSEAAARGISAQELTLIKAHEAALKMNASVDRQIASQQKLTDAVKMNARGISEQEFQMIKAHEAALKMNKAMDEKAKRLAEVNSRGSIWNNTLKSMVVAATAYVGVNFAKGLFEQADAWVMMQSKLSLAVGSMSVAKSVQQDLYETAQRLRIPLEDSAKLFTRMAVPLQKMGFGLNDTKTVVESFSMALKLAGATGQEASSAMLQFSQSINAGRLNGGEFNSVAEASPNVLRAIEAELIRTGRAAELSSKGLKKMAAEGLLTTPLLVGALKSASEQWKKDFESLPITVDGAIQRIKNIWLKTVGELGENTKFNEQMAASIKKLEEIIPAFANLLVGALTMIIQHGDKLLALLGGLAAAGALFKTWGVISAFNTAAVAAGGFANILPAVRAGMIALGLTPMGLAITAVGVAIGALIYNWKDLINTQTESQKLHAKISENSANYVKSLQAETAALEVQINKLLVARGEQEKYNIAKKIGSSDSSKTGIQKMQEDLKKLESDLQATQAIKAPMLSEEDVNKGREIRRILKDIESQKKLIQTAETESAKVKDRTAEAASLQKNKEMVEYVTSVYLASRSELKVLQDTRDQKIKLAKETFEKLSVDEVYRKQALLNIEKDYQEEVKKLTKPKVKENTTPEITNLDKMNKLITEQRTLTKEWELFGDKKLTLGQKAVISLEDENRAIMSSLKAGKIGENILTAKDKLLMNATLETNKQAIAQAKIADAIQKQRELSQEETSRIGKASDEVDSMQTQSDILSRQLELNESIKLSKVEQAVIDADENVSLLARNGIMNEEYALALRRLKLAQDIRDKTKGIEAKDADTKSVEDAKKRLDDLFDTSKVDKFENASTKALKGIVKGFGELNKALNAYGVKQSKIDQARRDNLEVNYGDFEKFSSQERAITEKEVDYKLASYADMADAAKNFFNEGSKGYQAMDAVSKIYHTAQMARNLTEMAMLATKGVMNQADGDVYTAIPRMAAMAAVMAGLGYSVGVFGNSGSGGMKAEDVQKTQGAGSVFGDATAKSDSIKKSLELLKSSYDKLYPVNMGMLSALKNIESSMVGLSNLVLRAGGVIEGTNMGIATGKLKGNIWGSTNQNVVDSGLQFGGKLSELQKGRGFNQYASVDTTTSSWFGLKKDTRNSMQTQGLSDEISSQLGLVFTNMQKSLEEAGKVLYGSSKGVTDALDSLVLSASKISLKGLSGQALTDAINAVISKGLDEMASAAFQSFDKFRQVGEGYSQTVIRVANNFATVNAVFGKMGMKLYETSDAGIAASMAFTDLFDSLENMQSVASEYYDKFYTEAEKQAKITEALKKQFAEMNLVLPDSAKAYRELVDNTTDPAKIAMLWKLSGAFSEVFGSIEQGAKELPQVMKDTFDTLAKDAERWLSIRNQAASLSESINEAMGGRKDPAARMKQLWEALSSDISPEQKLQLAGELKDMILSKYNVEKESLQKLIDFGRQLRTYVESLKVGSLSPLTMSEKLVEAQRQYQSTLAKAQGGDTTAQGALQGKADTYLQLAQTALASSSGYQSIFNNVTATLDSLGIESMSASEKAQVTADDQLAELQKLKDFADDTSKMAQGYYASSLDALVKQLNVMDAMYQKMGIFDGIRSSLNSLPAEIAAAIGGQVGSSNNDKYVNSLYNSYANKFGSQIDTEGYNFWMDYVQKMGREATTQTFQDTVRILTSQPPQTTTEVANLKIELSSVVTEIQGLRADQQAQTGALIESTLVANNNNATVIADAVTTSASNDSWKSTVMPALV